MEGDGTDGQQRQSDRRRDADRRPQQSDEHTGDAGKLQCADRAPLER